MVTSSAPSDPLVGVRGRSLARCLAFLLVLSAARERLEAAVAVELTASLPNPVPAGTMVHWTAQVATDPSQLWYRFRVMGPDGHFRTIRDYGPSSTLDWTALDEGLYVLEVAVRDRGTEEIAFAWSPLELQSRLSPDQPAVSQTAHPLVFLYSGPACDTGRARVRMESEGDGTVHYTGYKPCLPGRSLNFYLAGLVSNSLYTASLVVELGREATVLPPVEFRTGDAAVGLPFPIVDHAAERPQAQQVLLQAPIAAPPIATDLAGRWIWYGPSDLTYLTRPAGDGTFIGLIAKGISPEQDVVRQFDLVGMTIQETNVARVNEQLAVQRKRQISGFHHEARRLADGNLAVLAGVEQILTDVQGPGPIDVLGDMIVVLDPDLNVVWTWDTFDHLDPARSAVLGEICSGPGCAPHYLAPVPNDWTHGNAIGESPDGALLYSSRSQDWIVKVDYAHGAGSGDVFWRLGKDGDFTFDSEDPYPWFSHQHDPDFEPGSASTMTVFDNGNTRVLTGAGTTSRGQALEIDEPGRTVRLRLNADLGVFSPALGAAQRLSDGTYHFDAGFVSLPSGPGGSQALSLQIDPEGNTLVFSVSLPVAVYRSFRLDDLYGQTFGRPRPNTLTLVDR